MLLPQYPVIPDPVLHTAPGAVTPSHKNLGLFLHVSILQDPDVISFAGQRCYPRLGIPSFPIQLCILLLEKSLSLHKNLGLFLQCLRSVKSRRGFVCSQSHEAIVVKCYLHKLVESTSETRDELF